MVNMQDKSASLGSLAVIILTYNEEANIAQALNSVSAWANEVFILDSLSSDKTLDIARQYSCHIEQNKFENYAKQRNYALDHLAIKSEWIFFLDADEWLSEELKSEISKLITQSPNQNGFFVKRRLVWMERWIRRGYYPSWQLRLFRFGKGRCEDRAVNEHFMVEGEIGHLQNDFTDENRKGVSDWIAKHVDYATREAQELFNKRLVKEYQEIDVSFFGTQAQRRRWLRYRVWNNLPPLIRPFFYFIYRYILLGGFLDGREAFIFHFLQALWYPLLIDIKYLELKKNYMKNVADKNK
jgi:glycosyltransferase involved in cell wall biosynthesis